MTNDLAETTTEVPGIPFSALGASEPVVAALAKRGITTAFAIQELVIPDALDGVDVLAKSRTGSGKTLAFAVPIAERLSPEAKKPACLVLVPTRELATQVAEEFAGVATAKNLRVATVYGGVGIRDQAQRAARAHIIVATPGRLLDIVGRGSVRLDAVTVCVLDEADRMLDMGFLPDVNKILAMLPSARQTMLFSATLDGEVGRLALRYTDDAVRHEVEDARPVVATAEHRFVAVDQGGKTEALVRELAAERGRTLIFTRTKRGADRLARTLRDRGFKAQALHGDMTQSAREKALGRFDSGRDDVLVATDVAARGLHVEEITHVVNYDPPDDEKAYVHRVGRTARAGRSGIGITFVMPDQRVDVGRIGAKLQLATELADAGMKAHGPRTVYTGGRGRNRLLGKRPRRRF